MGPTAGYAINPKGGTAMRRFSLKIIALVFFGFVWYKHGYVNGWEGYKHSRNMQFALDSAYQYGVSDTLRGCKKEQRVPSLRKSR